MRLVKSLVYVDALEPFPLNLPQREVLLDMQIRIYKRRKIWITYGYGDKLDIKSRHFALQKAIGRPL